MNVGSSSIFSRFGTPSTKVLSVLVGALALTVPTASVAQEAAPPECESAEVKAPTLWIGSAITEAPIYVGPGTEHDRHPNSELFQGERAQVLVECGEWVQVRVVPEIMLDMIIAQSGEEEAARMLLFWTARNGIRCEGEGCEP